MIIHRKSCIISFLQKNKNYPKHLKILLKRSLKEDATKILLSKTQTYKSTKIHQYINANCKWTYNQIIANHNRNI